MLQDGFLGFVLKNELSWVLSMPGKVHQSDLMSLCMLHLQPRRLQDVREVFFRFSNEGYGWIRTVLWKAANGAFVHRELCEILVCVER